MTDLIFPTRVVAGSPLSFEVELADYPSATWALSFTLVGRTSATVPSSDAGDGVKHAVAQTGAETEQIEPAHYRMYAEVTSGADTIAIADYPVEVVPLAARRGSVDPRSYWEQLRDDARAAIARYLEEPDRGVLESFNVGNKQFSARSIGELRELVDWAEREIVRERREENLRNRTGRGYTGKIRTRMTG